MSKPATKYNIKTQENITMLLYNGQKLRCPFVQSIMLPAQRDAKIKFMPDNNIKAMRIVDFFCCDICALFEYDQENKRLTQYCANGRIIKILSNEQNL